MFNYLLYFFKQNKKIMNSNTSYKQYDFTCHSDYKLYKKPAYYKNINSMMLMVI
jgi:hypothetical protein